MGFFYRDAARYAQQVRRYFEVFGREKVHVIIFDDFKKDTPRSFRETCEFLGVNTQFHPEFNIVNPRKTVHSATLRNFLRYPPPSVRWVLRSLGLRPVEWGFKGWLKRLNTKVEPPSDINPALRQALQVEFLPEVEQLSELLDRDLTHWCRTNVAKAA
jgi:hypothetical protein